MFNRPGAFVSEPTAGEARPQQLVPNLIQAGFDGTAVRGQMGASRVDAWDDVAEHRNAFRAAGISVALWVVLDTEHGYDMADAAELTDELVQGFDGLEVNAEACLDNLLPYIAGLKYRGPIALSTLPTFAAGEVIRALDNRGTVWLHQQAYKLENGVTATDAKAWALDRPPVYVGWWYRATILGKGRRVKVVDGDGPGRYKIKEFGNQWRLDEPTRLIKNRKTGKTVGQLHGIWAPHRWAPTLRTTPMGDGRTVPPAELGSDVAKAGNPPAWVYLAETTPQEFWNIYRWR